MNHVGQPQQQSEGSGQKVEKYQRPTFAKWLSEGNFVHFERSWTIYKRSKFEDIQQIRDNLSHAVTMS